MVLTDVRWCGDGRGPAAEYTTAHLPGAVRGGPGAVAVRRRRRRRRGGIRCRLEGGRRGHAAGLRGDAGTGRWRLTERSRYQLRRPHRSARPATDVSPWCPKTTNLAPEDVMDAVGLPRPRGHSTAVG